MLEEALGYGVANGFQGIFLTPQTPKFVIARSAFCDEAISLSDLEKTRLLLHEKPFLAMTVNPLIPDHAAIILPNHNRRRAGLVAFVAIGPTAG